MALAKVGVLVSRSGFGVAPLRDDKPVAQNGGIDKLLSASALIRRCSSFMPLTPSISEWCIFMKSAKRPPSRPSTIQVSHNGRERSRGCEAMRPASVFSCSSLPGRGNAVWRMW